MSSLVLLHVLSWCYIEFVWDEVNCLYSSPYGVVFCTCDKAMLIAHQYFSYCWSVFAQHPKPLVLTLPVLQQAVWGLSRSLRVGGNTAGADELPWPKTVCPIQHIITLNNKRGMEEGEAIARRLAGHWSVCGRYWVNAFMFIVWSLFSPFFFHFPSLLELFLCQLTCLSCFCPCCCHSLEGQCKFFVET